MRCGYHGLGWRLLGTGQWEHVHIRRFHWWIEWDKYSILECASCPQWNEKKQKNVYAPFHFTRIASQFGWHELTNHELYYPRLSHFFQLRNVRAHRNAPDDEQKKKKSKTALAKFPTKWNVYTIYCDALGVHNIIRNYPKYAMENKTFVPSPDDAQSSRLTVDFVECVYFFRLLFIIMINNNNNNSRRH